MKNMDTRLLNEVNRSRLIMGLNENKKEYFDISKIPYDGLSAEFQNKMDWFVNRIDDVVNAILYFTPGANVKNSLPTIKKIYKRMGFNLNDINTLINASTEGFISALPQILLYSKSSLEKIITEWKREIKHREDKYGDKKMFSGEFDKYNIILDELKQLCPEYRYEVSSYYDENFEVQINEITAKYKGNSEVYVRINFSHAEGVSDVEITSGKYIKKRGYSMNDEMLEISLESGGLSKLVKYMKDLGRLNTVPNQNGINPVNFDEM